MAYIRNKDISKVGIDVVSEYRGVLLTEIRRGYNKRVQKKVPTYNFRGKLLTRPKR